MSLEVYDKTPFLLTEDAVNLHGSIDVDWRRADAGVGLLGIKLRVSVASLADAEALEPLLAGAASLYDAATEDENHRPTQVQAPRGLDGTRTLQVWIASDGRQAGEPMIADVDIRSLTMSSSKGGCTLTVGMRGRVSATSLASWDAIAAGPVIAHAVAAQPTLFPAKEEIIDLPDDVDPFGDSA
jgi:hypothetical protein